MNNLCILGRPEPITKLKTFSIEHNNLFTNSEKVNTKDISFNKTSSKFNFIYTPQSLQIHDLIAQNELSQLQQINYENINYKPSAKGHQSVNISQVIPLKKNNIAKNFTRQTQGTQTSTSVPSERNVKLVESGTSTVKTKLVESGTSPLNFTFGKPKISRGVSPPITTQTSQPTSPSTPSSTSSFKTPVASPVKANFFDLLKKVPEKRAPDLFTSSTVKIASPTDTGYETNESNINKIDSFDKTTVNNVSTAFSKNTQQEEKFKKRGTGRK